MIRSFKNATAERLFNRERVKEVPPELQRRAYRKLRQLHGSTSLEDLKVPPRNRLEALAGDRMGQYSIRINKQWRICFAWYAGHAFDVEVVYYH